MNVPNAQNTNLHSAATMARYDVCRSVMRLIIDVSSLLTPLSTLARDHANPPLQSSFRHEHSYRHQVTPYQQHAPLPDRGLLYVPYSHLTAKFDDPVPSNLIE